MPGDALCPNNTSIYKVARAIKQHDRALFNCLNSIKDDAAFVAEIRVLYPDLPLLANLRCGLWYAPNADATCCFKSTDGHSGNCQFSCTRLNWHVAELAARRGGCLVVDATRRGKRFPDAMSKTIPIWAAVINRAVARVRMHDAQKAQRRRSYTSVDGEVLAAVADTQTSISVRQDDSTVAPAAAGAAAAAGVTSTEQQQQPGEQPTQEEQQEEEAKQHQQQQARGDAPPPVATSSGASSSSCYVPVEQVLLDCMGRSSLELLSGLSVTVPRPPTPELTPTSSQQQHLGPSAAAASAAASALLHHSPCSTPSGSPTARRACQRRLSLHISPQPSLHEWLGEADVAHRLALLASCHDCHDCSRSPARRVPRTSCHSIGRAGERQGGDAPGPAGCPCGDCSGSLYASSAPAVSCLMPGLRTACSRNPEQHDGCWQQQPATIGEVHSLLDESPMAVEAAAAHGAGLAGCSAAAAPAAAAAAAADTGPGFSLAGGGAVEPVTPRLGCCGGLSAALDAACRQQEANAHSSRQLPAALTAEQLRLLDEQHAQHPEHQQRPPTVGSAVSVSVEVGCDGLHSADFAFPPPELLAASASSSHAAVLDSGCPCGDTPPGSASSGGRLGSGGLALPEMPVVVLNGTSHRPGDAASILDIWRGTDLEDVASLPGISDFATGVLHLPWQASNAALRAGSQGGDDDDGDDDGAAGGEGEDDDGSNLGSASSVEQEDWLLVRGTRQQQQQAVHSQQQPGRVKGSVRFSDLDEVQGEEEPQQQGAWRDCRGWVDSTAPASAKQQQQQQPGSGCSSLLQLVASAGRCGGPGSSSGGSTGSWADEETGVGYDGLCAFATPAPPGGLGCDCSSSCPGDDAASCASASTSRSSRTAASGSTGRAGLRPSSPSTCSSCSSHGSSSDGLAGARSTPPSPSSSAAAAAAGGAGGAAATPVEWDTSLHLPLWVSEQEAQAIEAKVDGWVERLLEVGADVRGLAACLTKPLRPLWLSQSSVIWTNQVAHPSTLPFTPLLLVSASQPHQYERQTARTSRQQLAASSGSSAAGLLLRNACLGSGSMLAACGSGSDSDDDDDDSEDDEALFGGMSPPGMGSSSGGGCGKRRGAGKPAARKRRPRSNAVSSWSYVYVPGAGDDEESWAGGLTPTLFWQHCGLLLGCGPAGVEAAAKQLVQHHRSMAFNAAAASSTSSTLQLMLGETLRQQQQQQQQQHGSSLAAAAQQPDRHHPAPKGCVASGAAGWLRVVRAAPGAFWLGSTGLALGNLEGATAADVWRAVDAVLCCGTALAPALQNEYQAMQLAAGRTPALPQGIGAGVGGSAGGSGAMLSSSAPSLGGLRFRPTFGVQGGAAAAAATNTSSSFCSGAAQWQQQQQQQQQAGLPDGEHAACSSPGSAEAQQGIEVGKVDVAPAEPCKHKAKRKGGMLAELLAASAAAAAAAARREQPAAGGGHARSASVDSVSSSGSCASADSASSTGTASSGATADSNCSSYYSTCSDDGPAASGGGAAAGGGGGPGGVCLLPRLKWLPIESAKRDRTSLKRHLGEALEFVSGHLAAGHLVLLHDLEGHDNCVSVAVATLLGCFNQPEPPPAAAPATAGQAALPPQLQLQFVATWPAGCSSRAPALAQQRPESRRHRLSQQAAQQRPQPVSKQSVRQRLALVSSCYPPARPTRATLKQVFAFFQEQPHGPAGPAGGSS